MSENATKLYEDIGKLSPADQLRICVGLIEARKFTLAHAVVERVAVELGALLAIGKLKDGA